MGGKPLFGFGLYFLAWLMIWNFTIRTFSAHHADNAALQGLANLI